MENKQKFNYRYLDANIALLIGIISFLGMTDMILTALGVYGKNLFDLPSFQGAGLTGYGIYIILGALLYKSAKKQKYNPSKVWRIVELIILSIFIALIFIFFIGGIYHNFFRLVTDPNIISEYKVPAYINLVVTICIIISYSFLKFKKTKKI